MEKSRKINVGVKLWLEVDGLPLLGSGRLDLLREIESEGSLRAATDKLRISYRHAWGQVKKLEDRLGVKLIEPKIGGNGGGGSTLTDDAKHILKLYEEVHKDINDYVEKKFADLNL